MADHQQEVIATLDLVFQDALFSFEARYLPDAVGTLGLTDLVPLTAFPVDIVALTQRFGPLESAEFTARLVPLPASVWLLVAAVALIGLVARRRDEYPLERE